MHSSVMPETVSWLPAHPSYGSVSMRRYWQALRDRVRPDDRYRVESVLEPWDQEWRRGFSGKAKRAWQRRIAYPAKVRAGCRGRIAHVLDHSWADLLDAVPAGVKKVVTVHDLIPLRFPGGLSETQLARFKGWVERLHRADAVISVSQYTKDETVEQLGIPSEKIHVVPNGVELPEKGSALLPLERVTANGRFRVGSIGSIIARKNLEILPAALVRAHATLPQGVTLVRAGARLPAALADDVRNALGEGGLIELGHLSDAEVARFYRSIDVMAVPSLYEGFGLPVLEAMAAGVPVIASNATSLPEVGGDCALYFSLDDPEELARQLVFVAEGHLPNNWIERGEARTRQFSWQASLEGIYRVYDQLL
ncbi:MAG: glycosyltransferase family 1 protein [Luteolibacter sp.]